MDNYAINHNFTDDKCKSRDVSLKLTSGPSSILCVRVEEENSMGERSVSELILDKNQTSTFIKSLIFLQDKMN